MPTLASKVSPLLQMVQSFCDALLGKLMVSTQLGVRTRTNDRIPKVPTKINSSNLIHYPTTKTSSPLNWNPTSNSQTWWR